VSGSEVRSVTLVVCAAPLAERAGELAGALVNAGWAIRVVTTPMARDWVSASEIEAISGLPPIDAQRHVTQAKAWGEDEATVVAPLTFNTLNKWAAGIADNYALGILNESIALRRKTIAVPMIGHRFWNHPARSQSTALLSQWVTFLDPAGEGTHLQAVPSGAGPTVAAAFDVDRLVGCLFAD
jgi:phosphopantothenoylcysteine decarboxylase